MIDPSDDDAPAIDGAVGRVRAGSPIPTIADHDGGVARRLTTRCRITASVLLLIAAVAVVLGAVRAWTAPSAIAVLLAAGALGGSALLFRRARMWSSVAAGPLPDVVTSAAIVGPSQPLSPGLRGAPVKRRLGATVIPIRTVVDPQPGGGALLVHARADGLQLAAGDQVRVSRAPLGARSATSGRFVLRRPRDDAVFLATTRLFDTW